MKLQRSITMHCRTCDALIFEEVSIDFYPDDMDPEEAKAQSSSYTTAAKVNNAFALYRSHAATHEAPVGGRLQVHLSVSLDEPRELLAPPA